MASKHKKSSQKQKSAEQGELRIIGGQWKRTKINFPLLAGVRPTPSRVRETLFNWLSHEMYQSHCLDLFAGSGALGLEALSRGAEKVWFIDNSREICQNLTTYRDKLSANAEIIQFDATDLSSIQQHVDEAPDIIFCDPPFQQGLASKIIDELNNTNWLKKDSYFYLETESQLKHIDTPEHWELLREKKAGDVIYRLYQIL